MQEENALVKCMAKYSATNIPMLIPDEIEKLADVIWDIAGRRRVYKIVADDLTIYNVLQLAGYESYEGILIRRVEQLDVRNQVRLADGLIKMSSKERGKFIITTNSFDALAPELLRELCKIRNGGLQTDKQSPVQKIARGSL